MAGIELCKFMPAMNYFLIVNRQKSAKCYWRLRHITSMTSSLQLPVWKAKIRHYLASCTLQMWSNLTKISFQGRHSNPLSATYFSWRVSIDFWRNVYIDRSVTSRIETIVWRYNALSALGYNMGIRKDSTECDIPSN
jgi:hypothetical protein